MNLNPIDKVTKALRVYNDRGVDILEALNNLLGTLNKNKLAEAENTLEKVDEMLLWRDAAFHNFKSADYMAMMSEIDSAKNAEVSRLNSSLATLELEIAAKLKEVQKYKSTFLARVKNSKVVISKYHSGAFESKKFNMNV